MNLAFSDFGDPPRDGDIVKGSSQIVPLVHGLAALFCLYGIMLLPVNPDLGLPIVTLGPLFAGLLAGRRGPRPVAQGALCGAMGSSVVLVIAQWASTAAPFGGPAVILCCALVVYSTLAGALGAVLSAHLVRTQSNRDGRSDNRD